MHIVKKTWFAFMVLALFGVDAVSADVGVVAVVGGTIIDGNGGAPIQNGVVLIRDRRIIAVGDRALTIPRGATRIDAAGKFVIPGLMDANVHLVLDIWPYALARYEGRYDELAIEAAQVALKSGVTTVFDSWGPREDLVKARDAINSGRSVGSRIYLAGNIVGLGGPISSDFVKAAKDLLPEPFTERVNARWQENVGPELLWMSPEQVRREVRKYIEGHIDFLKFAVTGHNAGEEQFIEFSPRVQKVFVEEAHRAGIPVETHTTSNEGLYLAVEDGVDLMQHCEQTAGPERTPAETVQLIVERRIPCALLAQTDETLEWYRAHAEATPTMKRWLVSDENARALIRSGAEILLSTDGGLFDSYLLHSSFWCSRHPPGEALLTLGVGHIVWLRAVVQKGMKPMDALMAATRNIARAYKVDKDLGTLAEGKIADLVVLDKNPLEDSANYGSVFRVIKDGNVVDRSSLPTQRLLTEDKRSAPASSGMCAGNRGFGTKIMERE